MSELTARLRGAVRSTVANYTTYDALCTEAADEIDRLRGLLRVFPGYGLSAHDAAKWWQDRHAALAGTSESAANRSVATTTADQPSAQPHPADAPTGVQPSATPYVNPA